MGRVGTAEHKLAIECSDSDSISLLIGDVHRTYRFLSDGPVCYVHSSLGASELAEIPRFPTHEGEEIRGGCHAPMPGRVLDVLVTAEDAVRRGDLLVVLEAMKMEHQIVAPANGTVTEVRVVVGQQVDAGDILVVLDEGNAGDTSS